MSGKDTVKLWDSTPCRNDVCSFRIGEPEKATTEAAFRRIGSRANTFSE